MAGSETRLLLQLFDRGVLDRGIGVVVPDQPSGKLDAAAIGRDARLADQDELPLMFGEDDDRADVARAARIFPIAALEGPDELALPLQLGGREVIEVHSSISLSGISFVSPAEQGNFSARTAPTRSTAATIPSPGRPSRTAVISAVMAEAPPVELKRGLEHQRRQQDVEDKLARERQFR